MASGNKRKTTMAKLNRERKLIERRHEKQARKQRRRDAAAAEAEGAPPAPQLDADDAEPATS